MTGSGSARRTRRIRRLDALGQTTREPRDSRLGRTRSDRVFKMRSDRATEWLISLNFLLATAKRLAHETGRYEAAPDDARSLDLLD